MQTTDDDRSDWVTDNLPSVLKWIGTAAVVLATAAIGAYAWRFHEQPISANADHWGQLGDFFGGILNPAFSFLALAGLLMTLYVQSRELRLSREMAERSKQELELTRGELKNSAEALAAQNEAINYQRFEQTFFAWLDSYRSVVGDVCYDERLHCVGSTQFVKTQILGRVGLQHAHQNNLSWEHVLDRAVKCGLFTHDQAHDFFRLEGLPSESVPAFQNAFMVQRREFLRMGFLGELKAPFSTLQELLVWIESQDSFSNDRKRLYFRIISSHLSWIEGYFLFLACVGTEWPELRHIVVQRELLSGFDWTADPSVPQLLPLLTSPYLAPTS